MAERAASAGVTATVTQAAEFWRGAKDTLPLILGAIPFGVLFGALAMSAGMTVAATLGMSLLVFAGSSQFVAMGLFAQGVAVAVIVLTTFIVNLRHALYSASLAPYMRHLPQAWLAPLGFWLTDESFAVVIKRYRARDASPYKHWYFLGSALAMYGNWQLCTVIGIIAGTQLQGMTDWGLEFAMVVTFIGIVVPMLLTKPMVLALLSRSKLPDVVLQALQFVPAAVLSAIVVPMLAAPDGALALSVNNHALVAGVLAIAVAAVSRNLLLTIALGMAGFLALRILA